MVSRKAAGVGILAAVLIGGAAVAASRKAKTTTTGPNVTISAEVLSSPYGASVASGAAPLTVKLTAAVSEGVPPYTFDWSFGDGSPDASGNPVTHTYAAEADYTVSVTVIDVVGEKVGASGTLTATSTSSLSLSAPQYAETGSAFGLTAVLKDVSGNAISGQTVAFFQGSSQVGTAKTDATGTATFTATAPSSPNPSTPYSASFQGEGDFVSGATSNTVDVYVYAPLTVSI